MSDRTERCEDRINAELESRCEDLVEIWRAIDNDTEDGAYEALDNLPLSIDVQRVVKILLSTGGPADWFEATLDADGDITRVEYVYQDWFDGARRTVPLGSPEYAAVERFCEYWVEAATYADS